MTWAPSQALADFATVARLAKAVLPTDDFWVEELPAPHLPPTHLPAGHMAVYVFSLGSDALKVGKVGPKSQARYTSQHYNPRSASSTLAASLIADAGYIGLDGMEMTTIGNWIRTNVDRVNILVPIEHGVRVVTLLECFLQCRLQPRYEGFPGQRGQ